MLDESKLKPLLEALLLAAGKPMREEDLLALFSEEERPSKNLLKNALKELQESCESRGIRLVEIASGYQYQANPEWAPWISRLWEEKAPRYSRALLETLALIAYRQPITRGEIEDIRGVSISQSIFKTLLEDRDWIRIVGHREVPGKPALYATTKLFLDYFGLKSLEDLPALPEVMNMEGASKIEDEKLETLLQNALAEKQGDLFTPEEKEALAELSVDPDKNEEDEEDEEDNYDDELDDEVDEEESSNNEVFEEEVVVVEYLMATDDQDDEEYDEEGEH